MADVNPINGYQYFGATAPRKTKNEFDMQTFMTLLTVQLANQNPLEPMSDRDFFAQMAQLGQVQGIDKMQASLETSQAAGLIGKTVTAVRPLTDGSPTGNSLVTGKVTKISVRDGERVITLQEANGGLVDVQIGNLREITG